VPPDLLCVSRYADLSSPDFFGKELAMRTVPPSFSRDDKPLPYNFLQSTNVSKGNAPDSSAVATSNGRALVTLFSLDDDHSSAVPEGPNPGLPQVGTAAQRKILETLTSLFEQRPVWARDPLEQQLAEDVREEGEEALSWNHVNELLPHVAFK
jgi:hypothetical protein